MENFVVTLLRSLPDVNTLIGDSCFNHCNREILKQCIQHVLEDKRRCICALQCEAICIEEIKKEILQVYDSRTKTTISTLINATGVVLQTNLGRSLMHPQILEEISPFLSAYNNLEYDLKEGKRSERYVHIKHLLCSLLGCEDVLVVNNNASAVLLVLHTFGRDREVIISRGELVEIGGAFRIPEVMKISGSHLVEVGTTNKTHLQDYQSAITPQTSIIMKAHQSNFKQIGFCSSVEFAELSKLAKKHDLIDYYDLGSGIMSGLNLHRDQSEPSIQELLTSSPSLLSFSGDKLFGGPQAGIILGKANLIAKLKENHLLRALRVDKFTILALEATIRAYLNGEFEKIPTLQMLSTPLETLRAKAQALYLCLSKLPLRELKIQEVDSLAGGGSLPQIPFCSYGILLGGDLRASKLAEKLREKGIIVRILQNYICLDVRCIFEEDFVKISDALSEILKESHAKQ